MALPTDAVSTVFVEATFTDPLGVVTEVASQELTNTSTPISIFRSKLVAGDNTITIPTNARGVIITCNELCDSQKVLKGVTGDAGITIFMPFANTPRNFGTLLLPFGATPPANFIIFCLLGTSPDVDFTEFCFI